MTVVVIWWWRHGGARVQISAYQIGELWKVRR